MPAHTHRPIPLATYSDPADPNSPWVLSYFAQRRAAGWIGIALPLVVTFLTLAIGHNHSLPDSISASYYTVARNFFVGSLCAVGIFLISGTGYDEDRFLSFVAGALAFVVAFSPCSPPAGLGIRVYLHSNDIHYVAAALLFIDFAWICLARFTRTGNQQSPSESPKTLTPRERTRNSVFRVCGLIMFAAMAIDAILSFGFHVSFAHLTFVVEWICLWTFGFAWLVKGQQLLADTEPPKDSHQPNASDRFTAKA